MALKINVHIYTLSKVDIIIHVKWLLGFIASMALYETPNISNAKAQNKLLFPLLFFYISESKGCFSFFLQITNNSQK